jgi:nickel/cobalt exporter
MTRSRAVTLIVLVAIVFACVTGVVSAWSAPFGAPHPAADMSASGLTGWIFAEQAVCVPKTHLHPDVVMMKTAKDHV